MAHLEFMFPEDMYSATSFPGMVNIASDANSQPSCVLFHQQGSPGPLQPLQTQYPFMSTAPAQDYETDRFSTPHRAQNNQGPHQMLYSQAGLNPRYPHSGSPLPGLTPSLTAYHQLPYPPATTLQTQQLAFAPTPDPPITPTPPAKSKVPVLVDGPTRSAGKENLTRLKKKRGTGSRSGAANRRGGGNSDAEIDKLNTQDQDTAKIKLADVQKEVRKEERDHGTDDEKEGVALTEDDKLKVVTYITDPVRWDQFRALQKFIFITISQRILEPPDRITPKQIRCYWHNQAWKKYKAIYVDSSDGANSEGDGKADVKGKNSTKCKRTQYRWSIPTLEAFKNSKIYQLIDTVAEDVTASESQDFIRQAVLAIAKKAKTSEEFAREKLELAR
ncbi:hypothetical protein B0H34DRAFT_860856 [Crassisporium funariophilum]|nr:hypothetical protein B0H34DRAFT_860856 [Crassisporium funariophilum]